MSANNQTLVKEHNGSWYVFKNIMAESWDKENVIYVRHAYSTHSTREEAFQAALRIDDEDHTEYGVQIDVLHKDDAEVKLIEE